MINFNGTIQSDTTQLTTNNRGFLFGDAVFETIKIADSKVLLLEEHYFRLMSSMRILRMEIPTNFTMEFFDAQLLRAAEAANCSKSARVRITMFRNDGGLYLPQSRDVSYVIAASSLASAKYILDANPYEVELYKDFAVTAQLLSTLKTTNKIINTLASIYAQENDFQNCFLINEKKNVVEAINGNIFMVKDNMLITPSIDEGCINGITRKQLLKLTKQNSYGLEVVEGVISPFDLQKADELFITNIITGIQPITKYRKKEYGYTISSKLLKDLNESLNLV